MSANTTTSPIGLIALSTILPALGIIATALRFHLRRRQKVLILANDWMVLPALVRTLIRIILAYANVTKDLLYRNVHLCYYGYGLCESSCIASR